MKKEKGYQYFLYAVLEVIENKRIRCSLSVEQLKIKEAVFIWF